MSERASSLNSGVVFGMSLLLLFAFPLPGQASESAPALHESPGLPPTPFVTLGDFQAEETFQAQSQNHAEDSGLDWLNHADQASPLSQATADTTPSRPEFSVFIAEAGHDENALMFIDTVSQERIVIFLKDVHFAFSTVQIEHTEASPIRRLSTAASLSRAAHASLKPLFTEIDNWIEQGISWESFKANLKDAVSKQPESMPLTLYHFKLLKKYSSVPSELVLAGTPEKIAHYIWKNFSYTTDQKNFGEEDHWQTLEELTQNKKGDCEDFALFAHQLLRASGHRPLLLNIYEGNRGHTVTLLKKDDVYYVHNNHKLKKIRARSLRKLLDKINPNWKDAHIVDFDPLQRAVISRFSIRK